MEANCSDEREAKLHGMALETGAMHSAIFTAVHTFRVPEVGQNSYKIFGTITNNVVT
jgi:hypothetical protein